MSGQTQAMANKDLVPAVGAWVLENTHRALLLVTGGRWPNRLAGMPTLELHVTGRSSGERRSTLLTAPVIDGETRKMVARTAEGAEREQLWQRITENFENYAGYQANTDREIPVVVCEPAG